MSFLASAPRPEVPPIERLVTPGKFTCLLLILFLLTIPAYWVFAHLEETPVSAGTWALVVISALANIVVIAYHYTIPAHPKFLMVPWRRWILRVHIISGSTELVAGLIACFSGNPTAATIAAIAALFFHVPSAFFQTRIVFGSKAIMVPAYLLCIVTHGFCAAMLLANPTSQMWAVNTFLVFNVYVWCRVYYYLFDLLKLFSSVKYSISILAAGATMIPALFGSLGFLLLVSFIGAYILLFRLFFIRDPAAYRDFVREKARDSVLPSDLNQLWTRFAASTAGQEEANVAAWFNSLDQDGDGLLDRGDLINALRPWGLPATATATYAERLLASGPVDLARFQSEVWNIGAIHQHAAQTLAIERAVSDRDKAELVFNSLDLDGDGALSNAEIDLLLGEWGLPVSETRRYFARVGRDSSGRIDFSEFLLKMEPLWRYIYHEVFRANYNRSGTEMVGRGVSAVLDARKTGALREQVKRDLLTRVPFLAHASDELIANLAASLLVERISAGDILFEEGAPGDKFYLIGTGLIRVSKRGETLSTLGPGGCIGEGSLLTDAPRSAAAAAVQDSTLFSLTRAAFAYLTEAHPDIRTQLAELHDDRRVETNAFTLQRDLAGRIPFVRAHGSDALITDLAELMQPEYHGAGSVLIREGEPGESFYIVESGTLQLTRENETIATLGPGGCLGETALLVRAPRNATAVATADTRVFSLDRTAFEEILARHPGVREILTNLYR